MTQSSRPVSVVKAMPAFAAVQIACRGAQGMLYKLVVLPEKRPSSIRRYMATCQPTAMRTAVARPIASLRKLIFLKEFFVKHMS